MSARLVLPAKTTVYVEGMEIALLAFDKRGFKEDTA